MVDGENNREIASAGDAGRRLRSLCPVGHALDIIGDRWSLLIIRDMAAFGKSTFKEFLESDENIATNTLTARLKRLEEAGLIEARTYQQNPVRRSYHLTEKGEALRPILRALRDWGIRWAP